MKNAVLSNLHTLTEEILKNVFTFAGETCQHTHTERQTRGVKKICALRHKHCLYATQKKYANPMT